MATIEHMRALGAELKRARLAQGLTQREVHETTRLSTQYVSEIESGYVNPTRGFTIPSDDALEKLGAVLGVPISRLHILLGRFPDQPFPFTTPDTMGIAEEYDVLPHNAQQLVREVIRLAKELVPEAKP